MGLKVGQYQFMAGQHAWAGSCLPRASLILAKQHVLAAALRELARDPGQCPCDIAVGLLVPATIPLIEQFQAGQGGALRELLPTARLRIFDRWLAAELRWLGSRLSARDPRMTATQLRGELTERKNGRPLKEVVSRARDTSDIPRDDRGRE